MPTIKSQTSSSVIYSVSILILGVLIGKLLNLPYFELDKNINIIDLCSILATIFIGLYIAKKIQKDSADLNNEKEIFLNRFDKLISLFEEYRENLSSSNIDYVKIVSSIKNIILILYSIQKMGKHSEIKILRDAKCFDKIRKGCYKLRNLSTETSNTKNTSKDSDIFIISGCVTYSQYRYSQIVRQIESIKDDLYMIELKINNS